MAPRKMKKSQATFGKRRRGGNATNNRFSQRVSRHQGVIQSLELMKIALHACLATLFFVRELLPRDVFGWRRLPDLLPGQKHSYDDFIRAKKPEERKPKYESIRMMERGLDDVTDRILDLLEEGIFDAVVRRSLAAIQFTIMTDKRRPDTAVECYTITIDNAGKHGSAFVLGAELNRRSNENARDAALIGDVQKHIVTMNRNLTMLNDAPELPSTRALGVDLIYSDDCPKKYRAHGFEDVKADVDTDVLLFPVDERWTRASWLCGLINSGFHTAAFRVSWLQCPRREPWLMVLPPSRHEPGCDCRVGILECHDLQTVHPPMALDLPLVFEEIVLREWEIGLPTADELDLLCLLAG